MRNTFTGVLLLLLLARCGPRTSAVSTLHLTETALREIGTITAAARLLRMGIWHLAWLLVPLVNISQTTFEIVNRLTMYGALIWSRLAFLLSLLLCSRRSRNHLQQQHNRHHAFNNELTAAATSEDTQEAQTVIWSFQVAV